MTKPARLKWFALLALSAFILLTGSITLVLTILNNRPGVALVVALGSLVGAILLGILAVRGLLRDRSRQ
ncbi:hypothetical protein ACFQ0P_12265 [Microbacterium insulae]|uniref:Uncharacterized protein n=1 Tax=Microbacterium insulae TaxID=483014 RepID=A0ABW3AKM6_9MICO